jgi:hypothetical protein
VAPDPAPLDTLPLPEVVELLLARCGRPALAAAVTDAVDLVCRHLAAGGRLLVLPTDPTSAEHARRLPATFAQEYGFVDGAVRVATDAADLAATPRDAVLVVGTGAAAGTPSGPNVVVLRLDCDDDAAAALDVTTTAVAAHLGHLHGEFPVDLVADSDDDRERVVAMVAAIAGVPSETARAAAGGCGFDTRTTVVHLVTGLPWPEAALLAASRRSLRDALAQRPRPLS